ncbi:MAG: hypothetical protein JWR72_1560 [Flavisolibacter sp.]|jgi:hypothetical protein|nr:hypothetical protein [Flavisolibacter sp.]
MKKLSLTTQLTTVAFAATILFTGCKKEASDALSAQEEEQAATYSTESEAESEVAFNDVFDNVMGVNAELGTGGVGIFGRVASENGRVVNVDSLPRCVTVTIVPQTPGVFPKTVTLDFGAGCFSHGHLRSGKIKTVYTGRLIEPGSSATTTFENFKMDTISVEGTHKVINTTGSTPGSNQRQFKIEVIDGKLTKPNGNYVQWSTVRINTQIEGNGSVIPADDIFRISGIANGKVKRNNIIILWNSEIIEPLIKKFICPWISKGRIRTVRQSLPANTPWAAILDYGTGNCDNQAMLTVNGNTHQITLH